MSGLKHVLVWRGRNFETSDNGHRGCPRVCLRRTAQSQRPGVTRRAAAALPDLQIRQYLFSATNNKAMQIHVANAGGAASVLSVFRLTVSKINGCSRNDYVGESSAEDR